MNKQQTKRLPPALWLLLAALALPVGTAGQLLQTRPKAGYQNPVVNYSLPDPTVIKAPDGCFYLYATENIPNIPIMRSVNLVDWEQLGTAFTHNTRPTFEPEGHLWAPDINFIDGQYVMYYSMSVWGGEWTCGIGVATANSPQGPFADRGLLMRSNQIGVQNSIDPYYIEDNGKQYLFWGSFSGLYHIELSANGLALQPGSAPVQVAGTAYEGVCLYKRPPYYYLFASVGTCCEGVNSTYTTVVGRSESLFGPFTNKHGQTLMDNHHEVLIGANERFVGTGHNSEIITDDAGNNWLLYHAVDVLNPKGRVLMLDRLEWENGWPVVVGATPSSGAPVPVFKK